MKGMFLAEPKKGLEHLSKAILIDLKDPNSEEMIFSYEQGIQSFPVLLDPRGTGPGQSEQFPGQQNRPGPGPNRNHLYFSDRKTLVHPL